MERGDDMAVIRRLLEERAAARERRFVAEATARYGKLVADLGASEAESEALGAVDWAGVFDEFPELEPLIRALARRAPRFALPWPGGGAEIAGGREAIVIELPLPGETGRCFAVRLIGAGGVAESYGAASPAGALVVAKALLAGEDPPRDYYMVIDATLEPVRATR